MQQESIPPPLPANEPIVDGPIARWRWVLHLLLLTAYPVVLGILGAMNRSDSAPMLPTKVKPLLYALSLDFVVFAAVFVLALFASRARASGLFLTWRGRVHPIIRGFVYAVVLRLGLFLLMFALAALAYVASGGHGQLAEQLRPETEQVVDAQALVRSPAYLLVNLTLVSFLFAGFREELWRAGMLAGFNALLPGGLERSAVRWLAVAFSGIAFGLGHLPQGWGGVLMTGALGIGLGLIMLRHRSIWEAVIAHGFFNATTFLLLYGMMKFRPDWIQNAVASSN